VEEVIALHAPGDGADGWPVQVLQPALEAVHRSAIPNPGQVRKYMAWTTPRAPFRCLRHSYFAAVVKRDAFLLPSYNGAPRGSVNCDALGVCNKQLFRVPIGGHGVPHTGDEYCPAIHAEANVVCAAARLGIALEGADLYVNGLDPDGTVPDCRPCVSCAKLLRGVGFRLVVFNSPTGITVTTPAGLAVVVAVHEELVQLAPAEQW
jgi:dCMP deaminase